MKTIENCGAQGDVLFVRLEAPIPKSAKVEEPIGGRHVLARGDSASGEHYILAKGGLLCSQTGPNTATLYRGADDRTAYLRIEAPGAEVVHGRAADQHESLHLAPGDWLVRRQREHTPDGFYRVED